MKQELPVEMEGKILSLQGSSPIFTDTQRDETNRLIFVKRIPGIITALEFAKIAMEYVVKGPILDIKYRRHTGGDKTAFALIYFQEEEDGKGAIEGLNGRHLEFQGQHRVLSAERASRWTQQVSRTNLYVTNLPGHWTGEDLKSVFDKYGKVMQATVLPHPQIEEQNSGAGFVRFGTEEDAASAMTATDGKPATPGSEKILEVKYAKANIHKNRRNDPLVNAALLKDFRKRKAEFFSPHANKRLRYSAPFLQAAMIPGLGGNPYQQLVPRSPLPFVYLPTPGGSQGFPSTISPMLGGLQSPLTQHAMIPGHQNAGLLHQNGLLQQAMLSSNQFMHQQALAPQYTLQQHAPLQHSHHIHQQQLYAPQQFVNQLSGYPSYSPPQSVNISPNIGPIEPPAIKEEPTRPPIIQGAPQLYTQHHTTLAKAS